MHIGEGVMDVEVILKVESLKEFPGVLVQKNPGYQVRCLQFTALTSPFQERNIIEPGKGSSHPPLLLNVLVDRDACQCFIKIIWLKCGLRFAQVLRVVHAIVFLVLVSV